jgi:sulfite oxidase
MDYSYEVPHSQLLVVRGMQPFNAEPKASALVQFPITPDDLVYCRNHGPVEDIDMDSYVLSVETGCGVAKYTMHDFETRFHKYEVVAALQVSDSRTPTRPVTQSNPVFQVCR